jgi:hypothetical protein
MAKDRKPVAFGQRLLQLRHEVEARITVMCPHPLGSRAEKAWMAWARGVAFGCVVVQDSDTGPGADLGTDVCSEKISSSRGSRRRGIVVCKDPTDAHGSRGEQAVRRQRFAEDRKGWKGKDGSKG